MHYGDWFDHELWSRLLTVSTENIDLRRVSKNIFFRKLIAFVMVVVGLRAIFLPYNKTLRITDNNICDFSEEKSSWEEREEKKERLLIILKRLYQLETVGWDLSRQMCLKNCNISWNFI